MSSGHTIRITGKAMEQTIAALCQRLNELGYSVEPGEGSVLLLDDAAKEGENMDWELDLHDPPEFAAEKILDLLEERGWIKLDGPAVSAEEEAEITERLRRLGYIE